MANLNLLKPDCELRLQTAGVLVLLQQCELPACAVTDVCHLATLLQLLQLMEGRTHAAADLQRKHTSELNSQNDKSLCCDQLLNTEQKRIVTPQPLQ